MSVTFYCPAEPDTTVVSAFDCQCEGSNPNCSECHGTGQVVFYGRAHEVNLSNGNAGGMLHLMGRSLAPDYCGEWSNDQLDSIIARLQELHGKSFADWPTQDYVSRTAARLLTLAHTAKELKSSITYG